MGLSYRQQGRARRQSTIGPLDRGILVGWACALGVACGGVLSARSTSDFFTQMRESSLPTTYPLDGGTAYHYQDVLFVHMLLYGLLFVGACIGGCAYLIFRPAPGHGSDDRTSGAGPSLGWWLGPPLVGAFAMSVAVGAVLERALISWRFAQGTISSHVSSSRVLEPFYAQSLYYQHLGLVVGLGGVLLLGLWLIQRWRRAT